MSRGVRDDTDKLRAREKAREFGKVGDKIGYTLVQQYADKWVDVDNYEFDTIAEAVCMLRDYQEEDARATFAVARLELVMISRPNKEDK